MSPVSLGDKVSSDGDVNQCTHRRSSVNVSLLLYSGTAIVWCETAQEPDETISIKIFKSVTEKKRHSCHLLSSIGNLGYFIFNIL